MLPTIERLRGSLERLHARGAPFVAGLYAAGIALLFPYRATFQFDSDEGFNLAKAQLVRHGHHLYSDIYSDQPPLFTYLLSAVAEDGHVGAARTIELVFAAAILSLIFHVVRTNGAPRGALAAVALLVWARDFVPLSVSVMIGLPSVTLGLASAACLLSWRRSPRPGWLVASAVLLALSLAVKLFTAFLLPAFGAWILAVGWRRRRGASRLQRLGGGFLDAASWSLAVSAMTAALYLATVPLQRWHQLVETHMAGQELQEAASVPVSQLLAADATVYGLAAVGLVVVVARRDPWLLLFAGWFVAAALGLSTHAPVWYHHGLLLLVPSCILGGVAVDALFRPLRRAEGGRRAGGVVDAAVRLAAIGAVVLGVARRVRSTDRSHYEQATSAEESQRYEGVLAFVRILGSGKLVVSNSQMVAYRAGDDVPASLAMTSNKRILSGALDWTDIVDVIDRERPEEVILMDRHWESFFCAEIEGELHDYTLTYADLRSPGGRVYVRKDAERDPVSALAAFTAARNASRPGYDSLGVALGSRHQDEDAVAAFRKAGGMDAAYPVATIHLGDALLGQGREAEGLEVLQEAARRAASAVVDGATALHARQLARAYAWRAVTSKNPDARNPGAARGMMDDVERRYESTLSRPFRSGMLDESFDLEVRAAVAAASGAFDEAVTTVKEAIARRRGASAETSVLKAELERYARRQPWTEAVEFPRDWTTVGRFVPLRN